MHDLVQDREHALVHDREHALVHDRGHAALVHDRVHALVHDLLIRLLSDRYLNPSLGTKTKTGLRVGGFQQECTIRLQERCTGEHAHVQHVKHDLGHFLRALFDDLLIRLLSYRDRDKEAKQK